MRKRLRKKLMQHPKNLYAHYKALNEGKQPPTPMKPPRRSSGKSWYNGNVSIYVLDVRGALVEGVRYKCGRLGKLFEEQKDDK